jgi:hypothetical protein
MPLFAHTLSFALLSIFLCRLLFTGAFDCSIPPQSLKLQNATFKNGQAVNRGISASLPGNQIVGLRPTFVFNNTRLRNSADCSYNNANDSQFVICEGESGSVFNPNVPDFQQLLGSDWAKEVETVDPPPLGLVPEQGLGFVQFDSGSGLQLPMEVWSHPGLEANSGTPNRSFVALGPKSSLLERLIDGGNIPSRALGLFYGSRSVELPTDGEFHARDLNRAS